MIEILQLTLLAIRNPKLFYYFVAQLSPRFCLHLLAAVRQRAAARFDLTQTRLGRSPTVKERDQ
ncbi:hypothetical protein SAMN04488077_12438 [Roseovarius tolerans]|uniref:Uncharacterized protein n=1 Tax=Roseovarius tolerans TaxID=74031 RepID=A0A1H8IP49_9RHOB|nr:hypothetical protein SAMN04488077_12438 [Roseovarius tolerans]